MGLDRIGTFRAKVTETAISKTAVKGLPQFVVRALLTEVYDPKEEAWFDYTDFNAEVTAYACLYGVSKKTNELAPTLSYDQIVKAFDWDGASLAELATADFVDREIQFRIGDNTYEKATTPYQVDWIDTYDADPVHQLRKLDTAEVAALDAQFSALAKGGKKAVSAKAGATKAPAKVTKKATAPKTDVAAEKPLTAAEKKAASRAKSERIKAANIAEATGTPVLTPAAPGESVPLPEAKESLTKAEAWDAIQSIKDPDIDNGTVEELWNAAIAEVCGEGVIKHKDVTGEQWYQIKEIVVADCGKF
ncbi:hypothetical protein LCGC14_0720060 [marine sediment metagenome]|uniref:Uncharacterized protein n=1 Tax=marine sediment metagenome TaxID=412755 RepID=A0A0F9QCR3_9ZZZZ